jgi:hypothetical protein
MRSKLRLQRPSHTTVAAYLGLVVALGGTGAYAANEWNGSNIQDGTLTGADIQDLSLGLPDYGANSISTGKLKDQDVRTQDLRDLGVSNPKIAWDSVSSGKVINNNLTGDDINEATLRGVSVGGYEIAVDVSSLNSDPFKSVSVACPPGKRAVGGGGDIDINETTLFDDIPPVYIVDSRPSGFDRQGRGWLVQAAEEGYRTGGGIPNDWDIRVFAVCVNAP